MTTKGVSEHSPSAGVRKAADEIIQAAYVNRTYQMHARIIDIIEDCTHAGELLATLQDIVTSFWEEYEHRETPPTNSPTTHAIFTAESLIRKAKGEL